MVEMAPDESFLAKNGGVIYNPPAVATIAQLVEQTIRNRQVMGSNPIGGSKLNILLTTSQWVL